jgi:hypothetical protein
MLVGHFGPALAIRATSSRVPLWALVLGSQAVDVLFFVLVLAGVEGADIHPNQHPRLVVTCGIWTHSLTMTAVFFAVCAVVGKLASKPREGLLVGLAVASHWFTDFIVHVPDLPLSLDQQTAVGLGLWRVPWAATTVEVGVVLAAALLLHRTYGDARRRRRLSIFAGTLVAVQLVGDLVMPLPPSDVELAPMVWLVFALATVAAVWVEREPLFYSASTIAPSRASNSSSASHNSVLSSDRRIVTVARPESASSSSL